MTTRVSVVIPVLDGAELIGATLEHVLAQTHPDVEIIVVDNGSTDGTAEVVAAFGPRVRGERLDRPGANRARNHGLAIATGAQVMFLDADDLIAPDTLAALSRRLDQAPALALAVCPWQRLVFERGGWRPGRVTPDPPPGDELARWIEGVWFVPPCGLLWSRALLSAVGPWDEELTINTDGDMVLRALVAGASLVRTTGGRAFYRRHDGSERRSVSMGRSARDLLSRMRVLEKVEAGLAATSQLGRHRVALGRAYHRIARLHLAAQPELARECERRAAALAGFASVAGSWPHRLACLLLGLERKERLVGRLRRWR
jgi:glycosyltransferase involved in cell wall biosynthesis